MNNFAIKFHPAQLHVLDAKQVNDWYTIKIYEKLIAYAPNEFKSPKPNYSKR